VPDDPCTAGEKQKPGLILAAKNAARRILEGTGPQQQMRDDRLISR
jgi:hypothetical protein